MLGRCELEALVYRPFRLPLSWASVLMLVFILARYPTVIVAKRQEGHRKEKPFIWAMKRCSFNRVK